MVAKVTRCGKRFLSLASNRSRMRSLRGHCSMLRSIVNTDHSEWGDCATNQQQVKSLMSLLPRLLLSLRPRVNHLSKLRLHQGEDSVVSRSTFPSSIGCGIGVARIAVEDICCICICSSARPIRQICKRPGQRGLQKSPGNHSPPANDRPLATRQSLFCFRSSRVADDILLGIDVVSLILTAGDMIRFLHLSTIISLYQSRKSSCRYLWVQVQVVVRIFCFRLALASKRGVRADECYLEHDLNTCSTHYKLYMMQESVIRTMLCSSDVECEESIT